MNHSIIRYILFKVLEVESLFFILPMVTGLIYGEWQWKVYGMLCLIGTLVGFGFTRKRNYEPEFFAKEGFLTVALSWILLGAFGAVPFVLTGEIPNYADALFETVSGFTTTGSSILTNVEAMSHTSLIWRSFTHWVGGMGVLVFILAVLPLAGGYDIQIMRAESPGPAVGKLVPKMKQTAMILYVIYFVMTVAEAVLLVIFKMPLFDSLCITFGTAGTGGFGIRNSSCGEYNYACQIIITVFMMAFGVNFNVYYLMLFGRVKSALKCEEARWYLIFYFIAVAVITINTCSMYPTVQLAYHHAAFSAASIMTTTGYATVDFDKWPALSKEILVTLMFIGACAGSTGGGLKVSRVIAYFKLVRNEVALTIHPSRVKPLYLEGRPVEDSTKRSMAVYFAAFMIIFVISVLAVSVDGFDVVTNFTAVAATFNNIGPGLAGVGPTQNFSHFSQFSKLVMTFDMLAGRLEIFPMLVIFTRKAWKKGY
jgi:trk system potassium uptake protein TrkH